MVKPYFAKLIGTFNGVVYTDHELLMCSRKIKVGDIAKEKLITGEYEDFEVHTINDIYEEAVNNGEQFVVLGKISAPFVKEGDEFEEHEIMQSITGDNYETSVLVKDPKTGEWV